MIDLGALGPMQVMHEYRHHAHHAVDVDVLIAAHPASEARKNLPPLIQQVNDDRAPVEITSRGGDAVNG